MNLVKTSAKNTFDEIYATFEIGMIEVALNVKAVQEVVNFPDNIIKMPLSPAFLVGIFNLRGIIIPIINLKDLLMMEENEVRPNQKVAIVEYDGAKVGLLFDSTNEIVRIKNDDINMFSYVDEKSHKVISGALKLKNGARLIQVLDPFALIQIENIPQIINHQQKTKKNHIESKQNNRKKCISFLTNGIRLAFEISGINEIIRPSTIEPSVIQDDLCLGIVNLRGQMVPVIDCSRLLNSGASVITETEDKRIIVLKLEKELFGLLVDSVDNIISFNSDSILPIPLLNKSRSEIFSGCIQDHDKHEIILLNHQQILNNQEILSLTHGHSKIYQSVEQTVVKNGRTGRNSYISFKLDHLFAVSINDVREIINNSKDIVAAPGMNSVIKGMLNLRGKLVMIIDTRNLYHLSENLNTEDTKILIFDHADERYGFVVDSIESIVNVDNEMKMKIPSLMVQNIKEKFENDIKEIVSIKQNEKESVLVILDMDPVINRIKSLVA